MTTDPFELFGLPHRYSLDRAALHRAFLKRSAVLHPDAGGVDTGDDEDQIAALNCSRATLEDPEKRGAALLRVLLARAGATLSPSDERALPDGFLMEMLEVREQMESDLALGDASLKTRWEQWGIDRRAQHQHAVSTLFLSVEQQDRPPVEVLRSIRRELNAWRYIERMLEQVHQPPAM